MPARIAGASKSTGISIQVPLRCLILSLFGKRQRMVQGDTDWNLNIPPHFVFCYLFHLPCRVTFLLPHSRWYQVTVEEYEVITVDGVTFLKAVQSRCKYIHIYCMSCLYCSMIRCFYWLLARRISLKLGRGKWGRTSREHVVTAQETKWCKNKTPQQWALGNKQKKTDLVSRY